MKSKKENEMSEKTYSIDLPPFVSNFLDTATEEQKKFIIKELEKFTEKNNEKRITKKILESNFPGNSFKVTLNFKSLIVKTFINGFCFWVLQISKRILRKWLRNGYQ
jgi:hypothetical protein